MAVFTPVSDDQARDFLEGYDLGSLRALTPIAEGVENTNYRLDTTVGRFVLTLFEHRTDEGALPFCLGLTDHLARRGYPAPRPMPDRAGIRTGHLNGRPASIIDWLEGSWLRTPGLDDRHAAGRALAALHLGAADYAGHRIDPMGPATCRALADTCNGLATGEDRQMLDRLQAELPRLIDATDNLPVGPIHADYFPDNVLFRHGAVSGVIDFYFACIDALAYDLAIALNAWGFDANGTAVPSAMEAFLAGYETVRGLNATERAALPGLGARAAVRFALTRLHDRLKTNQDALVTAKDPAPFIRHLDYWR